MKTNLNGSAKYSSELGPAIPYENVLFHDNYFPTLNLLFYGEPVAGACSGPAQDLRLKPSTRSMASLVSAPTKSPAAFQPGSAPTGGFNSHP